MNTAMKIIGGVAIIIALPIGFAVYSTFSSVVTAPSRVINKTLQTDNIITKYEWYYDNKAAYDARLAQVQQFATLFAGETDKGEKRRLRIELSAMQQTCRELAQQYNVNSQKMNQKIFKGWSLPATLSAAACEK